ncbi:SsgA family sporulation/cell division regulator [Streptomyces sp. NPDC054802]
MSSRPRDPLTGSLPRALSRELLTTGTKRRAGAGDVLVHPGIDADSVYLLLADRGGTGTGDALLRAQA